MEADEPVKLKAKIDWIAIMSVRDCDGKDRSKSLTIGGIGSVNPKTQYILSKAGKSFRLKRYTRPCHHVGMAAGEKLASTWMTPVPPCQTGDQSKRIRSA